MRKARGAANAAVEKLKKASEISEDDARRDEESIQKLTDSYIKKVDEMFKKKEAELMAI